MIWVSRFALFRGSPRERESAEFSRKDESREAAASMIAFAPCFARVVQIERMEDLRDRRDGTCDIPISRWGGCLNSPRAVNVGYTSAYFLGYLWDMGLVNLPGPMRINYGDAMCDISLLAKHSPHARAL